MIKKVTSSASTFAALSSLGDVFTFNLPNPLEDISKDIKERHVNVKPQLIWGLRKKFTAAQVGYQSLQMEDELMIRILQ
jgi:thermostable 8-oxoguanine DNA glycosylase